MLSLDEHRNFIRSCLPPKAFLRLDRGDSLFVTDAPRFLPEKNLQIPGYSTLLAGGILHITPVFEDIPTSLRDVMVRILKAEDEDRDRLIRTHLALALRQRDAQSAKILDELLKGESENEA